MSDPLELATLNIYQISMKLLRYIICANRSVYTNFDKHPSNGCMAFDHLSNRALALQLRGLGLVGQMGI